MDVISWGWNCLIKEVLNEIRKEREREREIKRRERQSLETQRKINKESIERQTKSIYIYRERESRNR